MPAYKGVVHGHIGKNVFIGWTEESLSTFVENISMYAVVKTQEIRNKKCNEFFTNLECFPRGLRL